MINQEKLSKKFSHTESLMTDLESSTMKELNKVFSEALTRMLVKVQSTYPKYLKGDTLATVRAAKMLSEVAEYLVLFAPEKEQDVRKNLKSLLDDAYSLGIDLGNFEVEELAKGIASFNPSPKSFGTKPMVEAAAFALENSIKRLKNYSEGFRQEASAIISLNLTLGVPNKKTASQLRERFGITQSKAVTIARTETMAALNESSTYVAKKNGLDAVQFFCTADVDTCPYCLGRNQKIYRIDDIKVPLHPRCRCFLQPFKQAWVDEEDFYDAEWSREYYETAKGARPVINSVAPFEKLSGVTAPKPIWNPIEATGFIYTGKNKDNQEASYADIEETLKELAEESLEDAYSKYQGITEDELDKLIDQALNDSLDDDDLYSVIDKLTGLSPIKIPEKFKGGEVSFRKGYPDAFYDVSYLEPVKNPKSKARGTHSLFEVSEDDIYEELMDMEPTINEGQNRKSAKKKIISKMISQKLDIPLEEAKDITDSITAYSWGSSAEIVAAQRRGTKNAHATNIERFLKDIDPSERFQGRIYRGMNFDFKDDIKYLKPFLEDLETGKGLVTMQSFSSNPLLSENFMGTQRGVFLTVKENFSGVSIKGISAVPNEDEVLVPKGTKYKLTERSKVELERYRKADYEGFVLLELEEVYE